MAIYLLSEFWQKSAKRMSPTKDFHFDVCPKMNISLGYVLFEIFKLGFELWTLVYQANILYTKSTTAFTTHNGGLSVIPSSYPKTCNDVH